MNWRYSALALLLSATPALAGSPVPLDQLQAYVNATPNDLIPIEPAPTPQNLRAIKLSSFSAALLSGVAPQAANLVFAGPTSGVAAVPTFRVLVGADLPAPTATALGGVFSAAAVAHQWVASISTTGAVTFSQPGFADLTGAAGAAQMPLSSALTWTGVQTFAPAAVAAPAAVTEQFTPSVVTGTSNTAGAVTNIVASAGTGTGAGGSYIINTCPAGASGTTPNACVAALSLDQKQHAALGTTAPVISACGTSPSVATGGDAAFQFTTGTASPTACTITFANSGYAAAPACVVQAYTLAHLTSYTVSLTAITLTLTGTGGDKIAAHCFGL